MGKLHKVVRRNCMNTSQLFTLQVQNMMNMPILCLSFGKCSEYPKFAISKRPPVLFLAEAPSPLLPLLLPLRCDVYVTPRRPKVRPTLALNHKVRTAELGARAFSELGTTPWYPYG